MRTESTHNGHTPRGGALPSGHDVPYRTMIDTLPAAAYSFDRSGRLTYFNDAAARLWGWCPNLGLPWWKCFRHFAWANGDQREPQTFADAVLDGGHADHTPEAVCELSDGRRVWLTLHATPLRDGADEPTGVITVLTEGGERRSEDAQQFLFRELKHRMKNALITIQAIAGQTFQDATRAQRAQFAARLKALDAVHELLLHGDSGNAPFGELVAKALAPFQDGGKPNIGFSGPAVALSANDCLLMSMVLHELATNAVKYGALSAAGALPGAVTVTWTTEARDGRRLVHFHWQERGGPAVVPPTRRSFGTALIERAFSPPAGGCRLQFLPDGVRCDLDIPY